MGSIGLFCPNYTCSVPGSSRGSRPFSRVGHLTCAEHKCRGSAAVTVPPCHEVELWQGLQWSGKVADGTVPGRMVSSLRSVYLWIVCIFQQFYILVPVGLMPCNVVPEVGIDCSVESFQLSIDLGMIGGRCQLHSYQARGN